MRSLGWTVVLLVGVMYVVGVYLTQLVADHYLYRGLEGHEQQPELSGYYGNVPRSLLTLFQAITGGVNWYMIVDPLMEDIHPLFALVMCAYVAFCLFALMNIVTGVF